MADVGEDAILVHDEAGPTRPGLRSSPAGRAGPTSPRPSACSAPWSGPTTAPRSSRQLGRRPGAQRPGDLRRPAAQRRHLDRRLTPVTVRGRPATGRRQAPALVVSRPRNTTPGAGLGVEERGLGRHALAAVGDRRRSGPPWPGRAARPALGVAAARPPARPRVDAVLVAQLDARPAPPGRRRARAVSRSRTPPKPSGRGAAAGHAPSRADQGQGAAPRPSGAVGASAGSAGATGSKTGGEPAVEVDRRRAAVRQTRRWMGAR